MLLRRDRHAHARVERHLASHEHVGASVAHGTAFDRAWQGTASADGMVAAMITAARLATVRTTRA